MPLPEGPVTLFNGGALFRLRVWTEDQPRDDWCGNAAFFRAAT